MEENAKVKRTRKVSAARKRKNEGGSALLLSPVSSRYIFVFALSQFSGPGYLDRSLEQSSEGITSDSMLTIVNPESDAHLSFVNVVTMPLNMAKAGKILSVTLPHVHNTVNGH